MAFYTYIVASRRNGTLYVGSTDDLPWRMEEHREYLRDGFTAKYGCTILVWYEVFESRDEAFRRERRKGMATVLEADADRGRQSDMAGSLSHAESQRLNAQNSAHPGECRDPDPLAVWLIGRAWSAWRQPHRYSIWVRHSPG
uniref:Excinuclease ABC C subunit domain protein n=1 Tax=Caulobacter sp. (strain K31) TaxID=366602 RepID=B0SVY7_CAUSK